MKQALKCDFTWADFKTNSDGMVPVVVQDAENDEVLMLAYMNEEAFETTLRLGKMTYRSAQRATPETAPAFTGPWQNKNF